MKTLYEVKISDCDFSQWLRRKGWKGKVNKVNKVPSTDMVIEFVLDDGTLLCKVLYDNYKPTRKVFMDIG